MGWKQSVQREVLIRQKVNHSQIYLTYLSLGISGRSHTWIYKKSVHECNVSKGGDWQFICQFTHTDGEAGILIATLVAHQSFNSAITVFLYIMIVAVRSRYFRL